MSAGILMLVPTPVGNLEDMTFRGVKALSEADLIAAEDTRNSRKLLTHFDIHTPMTSYHEHNKYEKADELVGKILSGLTVAVITDAGSPGISDPGEVLARKCAEAGITVTALPGATAFVPALTASGLDSRRFVFEGFLPAEAKDRREVLERLSGETRTAILYEAPHRLKKTLAELREALGDRRLSVCRELTKKHEEYLRMTLSEAIAHFEAEEPRGEFVLVLAGCDPAAVKKAEQASWESMTVAEHVAFYEAAGMDRKEAMKACAKDRGLSRRDVYQALLEEN